MHGLTMSWDGGHLGGTEGAKQLGDDGGGVPPRLHAQPPPPLRDQALLGHGRLPLCRQPCGEGGRRLWAARAVVVWLPQKLMARQPRETLVQLDDAAVSMRLHQSLDQCDHLHSE